MNQLEARRCYLSLAILVLAATVFIVAGANARSTVTTYSYNRDGALTKVTTSIDGQDPMKKYITWDNFRPNAETPTIGKVSAGDGRMMSFGPGPELHDLTARFRFDARDRLLGYSGDGGDESYDYHAGGMLLSSSLYNDQRYFYHNTGANPVVTNIYQSGSDLWSAYLGNSRFLNDGSSQNLLKPRKDIAASYDPDSRTMESYVFDAFGSRVVDEGASGSYDLHDNPFGYAGEYRDPIWGGIYLRARWYHPDLPVFLSRDPKPHLNRYAYGGGNPVMKTDPSGYSAGFWKKAEGFLRSADKTLNRGVGGHFARIFLAPLLGPLQIAAYPKQFWAAVKTNKDGIDIFLGLGVIAEAYGGFLDYAYAGYGARLGKRFGLRMLSDVAIGVGQSIAAAAHHGFSHFDWNVFGQGMEYTVHPIMLRGLTGFNVRQGFRLKSEDVLKMVEKLENADEGTALIFRRKTPISHKLKFTVNTPVQEALHMGLYHESLIAITKSDFYIIEANRFGISKISEELEFNVIKDQIRALKGKYELVSKFKGWGYSPKGQMAFLSDPYSIDFSNFHFSQQKDMAQIFTAYQPGTNRAFIGNKSQLHAYAILKKMGLR